MFNLNNEELRFSFEQRTKLVVELFVNGFGRNDAAVGGVDVSVATVREDDQDHHVTRYVIPVSGKVVDLGIELHLDQVLLDADLKAEVGKQLFEIVDVVLKIRKITFFTFLFTRAKLRCIEIRNLFKPSYGSCFRKVFDATRFEKLT